MGTETLPKLSTSHMRAPGTSTPGHYPLLAAAAGISSQSPGAASQAAGGIHRCPQTAAWVSLGLTRQLRFPGDSCMAWEDGSPALGSGGREHLGCWCNPSADGLAAPGPVGQTAPGEVENEHHPVSCRHPTSLLMP